MRDVVKIGLVLLLAAVLIDAEPWRWNWLPVRAFYADHIALVLLGSTALVILLGGSTALFRSRTSQKRRAYEAQLRWILTSPGLVTAFLAIVTIGAAALLAMLHFANGAPPSGQAALRVEAVKWSLGIVAASGAGVALLLNARRQQLAEDTYIHEVEKQRHTEADAAARRVTEVYAKAVEQLGSDDAAVRLGAIYALERVAQTDVNERQTIVDVLCAYLRMPYSVRDTPRQNDALRDRHQELQVRITAQRVLTRHLRRLITVDSISGHLNEVSTFWFGMRLDLRGAVLVGFDFLGCEVDAVDFAGATFEGYASFGRCRVHQRISFYKAEFRGDCAFDAADFRGEVNCGGAQFKAVAFNHASFKGHTWFGDAKFTSDAEFDSVDFSTGAHFAQAEFSEVSFDNAYLGTATNFRRTKFADSTSFAHAKFARGSVFATATFERNPDLTGAIVENWKGRPGQWPHTWTAVQHPVINDAGLLIDRSALRATSNHDED
jgi:uncharacterized protein YjbI with pentapeptide repeats